jgi:hypothetical protein
MNPNRIVLGLLCAGIVVLTGCATPEGGYDYSTAPQKMVHVTGVARYPSGQPCGEATVTIVGIATTQSDAAGSYSLEVPAFSNTVQLRAVKAHQPGDAVVGQDFGVVPVLVRYRDVHVNVVLDQFAAN